MPESYAVRSNPGGKKTYYKTKADYIAGRSKAKDAARKRQSRVFAKFK